MCCGVSREHPLFGCRVVNLLCTLGLMSHGQLIQNLVQSHYITVWCIAGLLSMQRKYESVRRLGQGVCLDAARGALVI